jgi:superfamily II DNA or RNA helicase
VSLFAEQYPHLRWPIAVGDTPGFRTPQRGALHAIGAHFSHRAAPAIVTMPTGSGKTPVLMATPFLLRAERALVITPSRLVREQIVERFSQLDPLRVMGVLDRTLPLPSVWNAEGRVQTLHQWEMLRRYDVVVGIPNSLSPGIEGIPAPPPDLFDVVLIDEAHHSPARTWTELLAGFPDARRVLFTATPFRTDRLEIVGEFLYTYELREAYEDGVFGALEYVPVDAPDGEAADLAIAMKTEELFRADRAAGLSHLVMVRTATRVRSKVLETLYAERTKLKLQLVTGNHSLRHVRGVITKLRARELDGIICVDMLGEGFDLPELKIAALHAPHKSLGVTLQFVGRFARTTAPNIGRAAFVATVSDMAVERENLYAEGAVWEEIIPRLSESRIREETETQRILASFSHIGGDGAASDGTSLADVSLHTFRPYHHAKVYTLAPSCAVDLTTMIDLPPGFTEVYRRVSQEKNTVVVVIRSNELPEWTSNSAFAGTKYDLIILHHHVAARLLFIHTSHRVDGMFEYLVTRCTDGGVRPLSLNRLNKVLIDLSNPEFFNIGMRNRVLSSTTETYRIITGPAADNAVQQSDGRLYHRGHFFGRGQENGVRITLGLSSASKVWSNTFTRIPALLAWFDRLAEKLTSSRSPKTFSGLDYLSTGREVEEIPPNVIAADWGRDVYEAAFTAEWTGADGRPKSAALVDADLRIASNRCTTEAIAVDICFEDLTYGVSFGYKTQDYFTPDDPSIAVRVVQGRKSLPLIDFLNGQLLNFFTTDFALLHGNDLFEEEAGAQAAFDLVGMTAVDWDAANVDITAEITCNRAGYCSIHGHYARELSASSAVVVFYDHGPGEMADFVVLSETGDEVHVQFYHCKGSGGTQPGRRLEDAYEVSCQAVKSVFWTARRHVRDAIRRRLKNRSGSSRFLKGTLADVDRLLADDSRKRVTHEMVIVQPGISRTSVAPGVLALLASANDYLVRGNCAPLRVHASS